MLRKIRFLAVILCVLLLGAGTAVAIGASTTTGGSTLDIASSSETTEQSGVATPTDTEMEDEDEPILTVVVEVWEVVAESSAAVIGMMFSPGI